MDETTSSCVVLNGRTEVHYASYPHIFIEEVSNKPTMLTCNGKELKRSIPPFFSRKDEVNMSGWRVPMNGQLEFVATVAGKERHISYNNGCVVKVR